MPADSTPNARVELPGGYYACPWLAQDELALRRADGMLVGRLRKEDAPAFLAAIALADQEAAERGKGTEHGAKGTELWAEWERQRDRAVCVFSSDAEQADLDAFVRSLITPSASAVELVEQYAVAELALSTACRMDVDGRVYTKENYVDGMKEAARLKDAARNRLLSHIAVAEARGAVPEGYVLVPKEPTPQMVHSTFDSYIDRNAVIESQNHRNKRVWAAMIASAPRPASSTQAEGGGTGE